MSFIPDSPAGEDGSSRFSTTSASTSSPTQPSAPNISPRTSSAPESEPVKELDSSITNLLLPLPPSLAIISSPSPTSSGAVDDSQNVDLTSQEFAKADISVAPDGSFIETSSGFAAREIKIHWDQHIGVGKSVRSPYVITAFVNQHGKQMYRVGRREMSAPAASAAEVEQRVTQSTSPSEHSSSPQAGRRSRMSMHALAPSIFRNGSNSSGKPQAPVSQGSGPRKLRKTRSIPDLGSISTNASSSVDHPSQHAGATSTLTGRAHSHSVTGADVAPFSTIASARRRDRDLFGGIMEWNTPSTSDSTSFSTHSLSMPRQAPNEPYEPSTSLAIIIHPFGPGVTFDSPSRKPATEYLPTPRLLREMQSFESGLTARQPEPQRRIGQDSALTLEINPLNETTRPPSALQIHVPMEQGTIHPEISTASPSPEMTALSRYSTDVFDVLQTYRGLPLLEKLSLGSEETTVIKMSLSADDTAVPRDDPRFVIWGETQKEQDHDDNSVSHESFAESSANSSMSKRRNTRGKAPESPNARLPLEGTKKVIIAATIERWIAQLTSDLNYDELLDFFLTYRTYVGAVDLCHLLICRFHWALQPATSPRDERIRQVVRVRTFVAMRYWVVTFFTVDFLPNRELRLLLASWLNTLIRDPVLDKHNDGRNIVRKLMKVAKECKQVHTRSPPVNKPRVSSAPSKTTPGKKEQLFGAEFAAATQKPSIDDEESDVDLDFLQGDSTSDIPSGYLHDSANAHLTAAHMHVGATGVSATRPASIPFSSLSILQRTEHAPGPAEFDSPFVQTTAALPIPHGALSRAFVRTIGRLGRWRRVLNSRSVARTSLGGCADVSAFDLEGNIPRELLNANGGVERFLGVIGPPPKSSPTKITMTPISSASATATDHPPRPQAAPGGPQLPALSIPTPHPPAMTNESPDIPAMTLEKIVSREASTPSPPPSPTTEAESIISDPSEHGQRVNLPNNLESDDRAVSFRSSSTDSLGTPLTHGGLAPTFPPLAEPQWQFPIASIEDLDLSDTSSDLHVSPASPPGLRRQPRKLPFRREFEFVRRPDTVSSMGLASHASMMSTASSAMSSPSVVGFGGNIAVWQMNALVDSLSNDGETGDVEDALRRLEGQINPREQQEKASKVDGWVRTMRERMAAGDYEDEEFRTSDDEDNQQEALVYNAFYDNDSNRPHSISVLAPSQTESSGPSNMDGTIDSMDTPIPTQTSHMVPPPPGPESPTRPEAKPAPEDAVPLEILQSRVSSRPSTPSSHRLSMSLFGTSESPRSHRSFILSHQTAELARHFAMIDRELFMGVKFEELVLDDWMSCAEVDVLDWAQYLKDRARWKAENRYHDKTSALAAVRARFNLLANFTISEIALTQSSERPVLVSKFIRIAWKAYLMSNFSTLVAIIAALQSEWVTRAMRKCSWGRVGLWENRMFKDLKIFTTNSEDFKYIRQVVESIVEAKTLDTNTHAPSVISGGGADTQSGKGKSDRSATSPACIPFIGIYLSQLKQHSKLPDLIDPTAPNEAVGINPETSNFDAPAHPEVFSTLAPLPVSMHLEPLINVHKQRRIAGVIKSLVAGQHLASRVKFDIDKRLFQKCLRLRGLDSGMLQRALAASE